MAEEERGRMAAGNESHGAHAHIGLRVRALRVAAGMSQQALGEPELSSSYISRIESGDRVPPPGTVALLAGRLHSDVEYLLTGRRADTRQELRLGLESVRYTLQTGEPLDALDMLDNLRNATVDLADESAQLEIEELAGQCLEQAGQLLEALLAFNKVLAASAVGSAPWVEAAIATTRLYRLAGDMNRSVEVGQTCLDQLQLSGLTTTPGAVRLLLTLMGAFIERGDLTHAAELGREALRRAIATGDKASQARAYWNASLLQLELGNTYGAAELAEQAIASFAGTDQPRQLALVQLLYAQALTKNGEAARALEHLHEASVALGVVGSGTDLAYLELEFARVALEQDRHDDVTEHGHRVLSLPGSAPIQAGEAHLLLGRSEIRRGRKGSARSALQAAATTLAVIGASRMAANVWLELAMSLDEVDDVAGARDAYRAAAAAAGLMPALSLRV